MRLKVKEDKCPECGGVLEEKGTVDRTVIEGVPVKVEKVLAFQNLTMLNAKFAMINFSVDSVFSVANF